MTSTTAIQEFDFGAHAVRVKMDDQGNPWWVANDICAALDINNSRQALTRLDDSEKGVIITDTLGGPQETSIISEPGLYRLIFRSNKDVAKKFQRWVFHEVLPAIRQSGTYTHGELSKTDVIPEILEQRISALEQRLNQHTLSSELKEHDIPTLRTRFSAALNDAIYRSGATRNMTKTESSTYHTGINTRLKGIMAGRGREDWEFKHYVLAVDYLKLIHDMQLDWIFHVSEVRP